MTSQALEILVEEHLSDWSFGAEKLAELLAIAPSDLRELSLNCFNMTPAQFIDSRRLQKAIMLLSQRRRIHEISRLSGYNCVRTFRRSFVRRFGMTPGEYQQLASRLPAGKMFEPECAY